MQVKETGDVIAFYNMVFIPATKQFVLALGQREVPILSPPVLGSNVGSRFSTPQRVPGSINPSPQSARPGGSLLVSPLHVSRIQVCLALSSCAFRPC